MLLSYAMLLLLLLLDVAITLLFLHILKLNKMSWIVISLFCEVTVKSTANMVLYKKKCALISIDFSLLIVRHSNIALQTLRKLNPMYPLSHTIQGWYRENLY